MSTHEEQSKRGELHSKLCELVEEHGINEVVWMLGQIIDDRGEHLSVPELECEGDSDGDTLLLLVFGEALKRATVEEHENEGQAYQPERNDGA